MIEYSETLRTRFFAKLRPDPASDCILFAGARDSYGQIRAGGRGSRVLKATHVSWFLKHGVWPTLDILHRCDNPPCVNPEHLFEGTNADNVADCIQKGRHATARLTGLEISELLALSSTDISLVEVAQRFGISTHRVSELRAARGMARKVRASRRYDVGGRQLSIAEIATEVGCQASTIYARVKAGVAGADLLKGKHDALRGL